MGERFRINAENVVHETVDGELIAIDLANGSYYSLSGSGPAIWELLVRGASEAGIREALETRFEATSGSVEPAVAELLARLRESELIVADEGEPGTVETDEQNGGREPFVPPVFERYTDMEDYFLLDPIHEVNPAAGWPKPAA